METPNCQNLCEVLNVQRAKHILALYFLLIHSGKCLRGVSQFLRADGWGGGREAGKGFNDISDGSRNPWEAAMERKGGMGTSGISSLGCCCCCAPAGTATGVVRITKTQKPAVCKQHRNTGHLRRVPEQTPRRDEGGSSQRSNSGERKLLSGFATVPER